MTTSDDPSDDLEADNPPPALRQVHLAALQKHPELLAMLEMVEHLEPLSPGARARVLGAVVLLLAPAALSSQEWARLLTQARLP